MIKMNAMEKEIYDELAAIYNACESMQAYIGDINACLSKVARCSHRASNIKIKLLACQCAKKYRKFVSLNSDIIEPHQDKEYLFYTLIQ